MSKFIEIIYPVLLLILFSDLFFVSLGDPVVIDYDEGVYAEVSREMYLDSQLVIPTLNGENFFEKPPMLYWSQILGYKMFGISALGARLVNALSGIATIMILYFGARGPLGCRSAFNASLILGSSIIFVYLSRVAMTDMLLTMFLTFCLITFWYGVEKALQNKGGAVLFWIACFFAGLAMLSKGAIGILFPVLTAVIYLLSIRRPTIFFQKSWLLPGTIIMISVGFSWYLLLGFFHPDGFEFMKDLFLKHHISRFSSTMEGHSGPIYYYLIILLVGFMPWFSYLPIAIVHSPLRQNADPASRFLRLFTIFSILVFVFFSMAATKLPNYILPALPGFALLAASLFDRREIKRPLPWRAAGWLSAALVTTLGAILAAAPLILPYLPELIGENARKAPVLTEPISLGFAPWFASALFIGCGFLIIRATRKNSVAKIFEALLLSSFIVSATLFLTIIPVYDRLMNLPLVRLAQQAAIHTPANGRIVMFNVSDRPSVNFASDRRTVYHSDRNYQELPALLAKPDINVGITTAYYFDRLDNLGIPITEISRDTGFVLFSLIESEPPHNIKP